MTSMCKVGDVSVSVLLLLSTVSLDDDSLMFSPGFKNISLAAGSEVTQGRI